jgi:hypothetical protein
VVSLTGERDQDLDRVDGVLATLQDHPGGLPVRVVLHRGSARRSLDRPTSGGAIWSDALVAALEAVAGRGCVSLRAGDG